MFEVQHQFLPQQWNNGFLRILSISNFIILPNVAVSQDPFFQYSSIPLFQKG
jgi:hypothetical protein